MGATLAEKILGNKLGRSVTPGEIVICDIDFSVVQDGTGPLTFDMIQELTGSNTVAHPERTLLTIDHTGPSPRADLSNFQIRMREFAAETGAILEDVGEGVSHPIMMEKYIRPGDIVVGADSHTSTASALGAFTTGMGSTDTAVAMALGKIWFRVPETLRFNLTGELQEGVFAKDVILNIIGMIGGDGATYMTMEYTGPGVETIGMDGRGTISSMAQEAGAKNGIWPSDGRTKEWLEHVNRADDWKEIQPDADAEYLRTYDIDLAEIEPLVAVPHLPENVRPVTEVIKEGIGRVNQVFIGTCTNGRLEDMREVAKVLEGRKVDPNTRTLIIPGTRAVYQESLKAGYIETFMEAGAIVGPPGCGPCPCIHFGMLGDGEVCVAAQNRNFKGRMGNPKSFLYLTSPAVAAATAVRGTLADPREVLA